MSTLDVIRPILRATYGEGTMVDALADHLAEKLDAGGHGHYASREDMVTSLCWDWMSGGTTAEVVARRIERVLTDRGTEQGSHTTPTTEG